MFLLSNTFSVYTWKLILLQRILRIWSQLWIFFSIFEYPFRWNMDSTIDLSDLGKLSEILWKMDFFGLEFEKDRGVRNL